ncbi:unnamed protein product [Calypogeia fissa]
MHMHVVRLVSIKKPGLEEDSRKLFKQTKELTPDFVVVRMGCFQSKAKEPMATTEEPAPPPAETPAAMPVAEEPPPPAEPAPAEAPPAEAPPAETPA